MAIIITGSGRRVTASFETDAYKYAAPYLHIEYTLPARMEGNLFFLPGDHASTALSTSLGSTSLTTDANGYVASEMITYLKRWGKTAEVKWTN